MKLFFSRIEAGAKLPYHSSDSGLRMNQTAAPGSRYGSTFFEDTGLRSGSEAGAGQPWWRVSTRANHYVPVNFTLLVGGRGC